MSNLAKLMFEPLLHNGDNYSEWADDAILHLDSMNLGETIKEENTASLQDRSRAMIFLRHHLARSLKSEYLSITDPKILWQNLEERFNQQKTIILPRARFNWSNLRLQDFKTVGEYNSALFRIVSQLRYCEQTVTEDEMLDKTLSTFHPSNMILMQQYRERNFKKYSDLISCLLVAEQNNEILLKNHQIRPTGSVSFPEVNATSSNKRGSNNKRGRGRNNYRPRGGYTRNFKPVHQKWIRTEDKNDKGKGPQNKPHKNGENICYRCGGKGHWSRTCRTPKHLVDLYQASIKDKGKNVETNFVDDSTVPMKLDASDFFDASIESTKLDVSDFFEDIN